MRKSIATVMAATIAVSALGLASASAADAPATTVVRSSADIADSGLTMYNKKGQNPGTGTFSMVTGPLTAPAGTGSLEIGVGTDAASQVGLCDGNMFNYDLTQYLASGDPADVIYFPVTYKPAALNLKASILASDFPVRVNLTLWRGALPVTLHSVLSQGASWQSFDVRTAQLLRPRDACDDQAAQGLGPGW